MQRLSPTVTRGAIAGFLGATVLALWFLVIDLLQNQPFHTPLFVASALAGLERVDMSVGLLSMYTALHFATFIVLGVALNWALEKTGTAPHFLLGLVLAFLLFDLVFYVGVIVTGVNVVSSLGWPQVLVGNLIAGVTLMGYLNITGPGVRLSWRQLLEEHQTIKEGLIGGLLGAAAVMLWFLVMDLARGQLLFTPAALGSAIFYGARGVSEVQIVPATIAGYTILHVVAFLAVGFLASALAIAAERSPHILLGLGLLFVTFEVLFIGLLAIIATWLLDALNWWAILAANLIAAGVMGAYLWHEHPKLREELEHNVEEEMFLESEV
jgi:hypothetical protein